MTFSIIIATLNSEQFLRRALLSIQRQTCRDYEIIVQDGGSTDRTLEILKNAGAGVHWVSEPDTGIYDAWNKAAERANGEWCLFLGSDDCFSSDTILARCKRRLQRAPKEALFAYGALLLGQGDEGVLINRSLRQAYQFFFTDMGIPFPATFIRLPLVKHKKFDTSFKIAGDFEFVARCLRHNSLYRLPYLVGFMEAGGISTDPANHEILARERERVLYERVLPRAQEFARGCMDNIRNEDATLHEEQQENRS